MVTIDREIFTGRHFCRLNFTLIILFDKGQSPPLVYNLGNIICVVNFGRENA